VFKHTARSNLR